MSLKIFLAGAAGVIDKARRELGWDPAFRWRRSPC